MPLFNIPFWERGKFLDWLSVFAPQADAYSVDISPFYRIWDEYGKITGDEWGQMFQPIMGDNGTVVSWGQSDTWGKGPLKGDYTPPEIVPHEFGQEDSILKSLSSAGELESTLLGWVNSNKITEAEAIGYYDQYGPIIDPYGYLGFGEDVKNYLSSAVSQKELEQKVASLGLDNDTATSVLNTILKGETGFAIKGAKARLEGEAQAVKKSASDHIIQWVNYISNNPYLTPDVMKPYSDRFKKSIDEYMETGDPSSFHVVTSELAALSNQKEIEGKKEPTADDILSRFASLTKLTKATERPEVTPLGKTAEKYLEGSGLGAGTKLRGFLEGQLPGIAEDTQKARQEWWQRMSAQPREQENILDLLTQWSRFAGKSQEAGTLAPTQEDIFYGTGGLRSLAEQSASRLRERLTGLATQGQQTGPVEDPFITSLKKKRKTLIPDYFRQPGAGLVNRLTPAVKY